MSDKQHRNARKQTLVVIALLFLCACADKAPTLLEGRPGGPYRLTLSVEPARPRVGEETALTFQLTYRKTGKPVTDLQLAHERLMHNFITDLEFQSFAHIHHEDFAPISATEREQGRLRFSYVFPRVGTFRVVSEFAHRNRNWLKHFDIEVAGASPQPAIERHGLVDHNGEYTARLLVDGKGARVGLETALEIHIDKDGAPVENLALYLGSELHGAVWRDDGRHFGHLHSYTPRVAAIMRYAHDRGVAAADRGARIAEMLVQLMCLEAELVFNGPVVPIRYVFPEPGRYIMFAQLAPGGEPRVFRFAIELGAPSSATNLAAGP